MNDDELKKEIVRLNKENHRLLEMLSSMRKDGFTHDQLNRKLVICDICYKKLGEDR